ncbi:hypothetical protein CLV90_3526 [Maribacter spongiicola]|uniref:Uncharacterized protein n=1 Tax=Maribacter spongiicola TaxID=1206753 RepID=A0A4R7JP77_9FLAO|nr:hypothetical protein [Maribacter spongiicola]TDT39544.1 hypothetical protein CLV90_3526 [Maribacter spongiicola]
MKSIDTSNNIITQYRNLTSVHSKLEWHASSNSYFGVYNVDHTVKNTTGAHQVDLFHVSKTISTSPIFSNGTFSTQTKNL